MSMKRTRSDLHNFYLHSVEERQRVLSEIFGLSEGDLESLDSPESALPLVTAESMVENCLGRFTLPMGVATNFIVDGREIVVPMVTEEPSIIAGASLAAKLCRETGGFTTSSGPNICMGQAMFIVPDDYADPQERITAEMDTITQVAEEATASMKKRGGGLRGIDVRVVDSGTGRIAIIDIKVDVSEAMGANCVTGAAERIKSVLSEKLGLVPLMGIITNLASQRIVSAAARWPLKNLKSPVYNGREIGERIVMAASLAQHDVSRGTTHRKGIMNGVTAVVLATGNDTRAVEAAVHSYALNRGDNPALTKFHIDGDDLVGEISLPIPIGNVGGSINRNRATHTVRKLMKVESVHDLARIIAAVGLAQNFAALRALVSEGISAGHMKLHSRNIACQAGASDREMDTVATKMVEHGTITVTFAKEILREMRAQAKDS